MNEDIQYTYCQQQCCNTLNALFNIKFLVLICSRFLRQRLSYTHYCHVLTLATSQCFLLMNFLYRKSVLKEYYRYMMHVIFYMFLLAARSHQNVNTCKYRYGFSNRSRQEILWAANLEGFTLDLQIAPSSFYPFPLVLSLPSEIGL